MVKFSEVVNKNFFEMDSVLPDRTLMYYLDYQANGKSRAATLLKKKGIKKVPKAFDILTFKIGSETFALIGVYIKNSDVHAFEECMEELERTAPFFCKGYKEARIKILDDIVVMRPAES